MTFKTGSKRYFASFFAEQAIKKVNGLNHSPREVLQIGLRSSGASPATLTLYGHDRTQSHKFATPHFPFAS